MGALKFNLQSRVGLYKLRYLHPETREVLKGSQYLEKGVVKHGYVQYLVDGKWDRKDNVPEYREYIKRHTSTLRSFLLKMKANMKMKEKGSLNRGKFLIGNNEFTDKEGSCEKLQAHYDEQVERYGPICPITHIKFTFIRNNARIGRGNTARTVTNLSNDRLINEQNYTKQNLLFTCLGWNLARGTFSIKDMGRLMNKDFFDRYMEILCERFPDQKYRLMKYDT